MTMDTAAEQRLEVQSSRLWAMFHFNLTQWLFPARMAADRLGVSTHIVLYWLTPWRRTDEHLPMSHVAEVAHTRGLIWDKISVESSGGLNPLAVAGLPKGQARYFVDHVRERLNEAGTTPPQPPPRR